jgi:formylglycine-generating enzyme required for sulfatase activity
LYSDSILVGIESSEAPFIIEDRMFVDKHLITSNRAKAMKSGFSYSLPTLGLLSILMLPLAGCDDTPKEPGAVFKDCGTCPEMVVIPAGSFKMGAMSGRGTPQEKPVHEVKIGYSFAVGKYEVTQAEWGAVMGKTPSEFKSARKPVENVSWEDAKSFINKLSEQTGKEYRLLSEAEWEYMARAGSTTKYPWGDEIDSSKAKYDSEDGTVTVGSYSANAFGVYDTIGNVYELLEDCQHRNYKDAPIDGSAWLSENEGSCKSRVIRGGDWSTPARVLRSALRSRYTSTFRENFIGFRIARTLSQ